MAQCRSENMREKKNGNKDQDKKIYKVSVLLQMIHASSDRLLEVLSSSSGPARRARIEENQQGLETRKYLTCREARM